MKTTFFTLVLIISALWGNAQNLVAIDNSANEKVKAVKPAAAKPASNSYNKALVKEYTDALKSTAGTPELYGKRATSYLALKDYKAAIADYNEVLKKDKTNYDAFYNR